MRSSSKVWLERVCEEQASAVKRLASETDALLAYIQATIKEKKIFKTRGRDTANGS